MSDFFFASTPSIFFLAGPHSYIRAQFSITSYTCTFVDFDIQSRVQVIMYSDDENEDNPLNGFWLEGDSLAPPCQAELDVVQEIITLANPSASSVLFDLGCGDGRICLEATKRFGCDSVGVEIEEHLISKFNGLITAMGVGDKVTARHEDLLETDLSKATIIVCYLLPDAIELIKPKLEDALRRGVVLVCNTWGPRGFRSVRTVQCGQLNASVNLHLFDHTSLPQDSDSVNSSVESNINYSILYLTYCSKEKREDVGDLPAIERYISNRIDRVSGNAAAAGCHFMILSGSFGFLDRQDPLPYYDHLMLADEVPAMVLIVANQIKSFSATRGSPPSTIKYYEVQEDPFVGPYKRLVQLICEKFSIDLEIVPTTE